jgi:hypothetical protein
MGAELMDLFVDIERKLRPSTIDPSSKVFHTRADSADWINWRSA